MEAYSTLVVFTSFSVQKVLTSTRKQFLIIFANAFSRDFKKYFVNAKIIP